MFRYYTWWICLFRLTSDVNLKKQAGSFLLLVAEIVLSTIILFYD